MFFEALFFISVFIIFFGEFLYPKIIFVLPSRALKKSEQTPEITILIPAYNEESTIADKIKNTLLLNYPREKMEIVVIDNSSSDKTYEIAKQFPVVLLTSFRGKINALNKGINYARTDVIIMTDADVELQKESVKSAVSYLTDDVGAVSGYVVPEAEENNFLMKEKEKYKKKDWGLRYRESMVDSVCNLDGKFIVFRKSIFPGFPKSELVDDYFMTFNIRGKGYRLIVDKSAKVFEKLKGDMWTEFNQFRRYATTVLFLNFKNIKFLFNPKYGYFGLLTFPFRRFFPVFYPIFLLYSAGFLTVVGILKIKSFGFKNVIIMPIGLAVFLILFAVFLLFRKKPLALIQLSAVLSSYIGLFKKKDLKFGKWLTAR